MTDCKATVAEILQHEAKMTSAAGKVANFAYTNKAYDENLIEGTPAYNYSNEQNIPLGTPEGTDSNITTLTKGYRAMGSSIARMIANHFFGRCSYNLNKIHDWFYEFLKGFSVVLKGNIGLWNAKTTYSMGEYCFVYTKNHLFRQYMSKQNDNINHNPIDVTQDSKYWELMNASWDLRETGNALTITGDEGTPSDMNELQQPATYKNVSLEGVKHIPEAITTKTSAVPGKKCYATIIVERTSEAVRQYIYYADLSKVNGEDVQHYLTMRGGIITPSTGTVEEQNWTKWNMAVDLADNLNAGAKIGGKEIAITEGNIANSTTTGTKDIKLVAQNANHINFGGTSKDTNVIIGANVTEERPIPTSYTFGTGNGSAELKAASFKATGSISGSSVSVTGNVKANSMTSGGRTVSTASFNYSSSSKTLSITN